MFIFLLVLSVSIAGAAKFSNTTFKFNALAKSLTQSLKIHKQKGYFQP